MTTVILATAIVAELAMEGAQDHPLQVMVRPLKAIEKVQRARGQLLAAAGAQG
jgi:hypothetical protein